MSTMRCRDALKLMHATLDGEASDAALADLSAHTAECSTCANAWESLSGTDALLRDGESDLPDDAYFQSMALEIGARARERGRRPRPAWLWPRAPAWGMAAACLILGLVVGHTAFPRTVVMPEVVLKSVPGPERVVTEFVNVEVPGPERIVYRDREVRVRGPVRTVYVERPAPSTPARPPEPVMASTPSAEPAAVAPATPAVHMASSAGGSATFGRDRTMFAALAFGSEHEREGPSLSADEMRALASRLAEELGPVDDTLHTTRLAATLVSEIDSAGATRVPATATAADAADIQ